MTCIRTKLASSGVATAFAMLTVLLGGCGGSQPEDLDTAQKITSALGSTQPQRTVANWNELVSKMSPTANLLLTSDLDANGKTWTPNTFSGTFDAATTHIEPHHQCEQWLQRRASSPAFLDAIVRKVRFVNLKVTGASVAQIGGLAAWAERLTHRRRRSRGDGHRRGCVLRREASSAA